MKRERVKILVVDDDANLRSAVCTCLDDAGYAVTRAPDGAAALERLRGDAPDLILLDLSMPRMDGMAFLAELSQRPGGLPAKTVVMTGHSSVRAAVQAVLLGASDFLEKPFTPDDLRLSVAGVLEYAEPRPPSGPASAGATYDAVLAGVRQALSSGQVDRAEDLLTTAESITDADPGFLNLAGAIHEAHGRLGRARRYYRRAVSTRPGGYAPAKHNLARLDEADRTGRPPAGLADLGDGRPVADRTSPNLIGANPHV
jgi:CheY-like chemotaxis protein